MNCLNAPSNQVCLARQRLSFVIFQKLFQMVDNYRKFSIDFDCAYSKIFSFQDVLAEVPRQVAEYMERNRFRPGVPDVAALDFDQMRLSCA